MIQIVYRVRDGDGRVIYRQNGRVVASGRFTDSTPVYVASYWYGGEQRLGLWPITDCVLLDEWLAEPPESRDAIPSEYRPPYWVSSDSIEGD